MFARTKPDDSIRKIRNKSPAIDLAVSGDPCMVLISKTDDDERRDGERKNDERKIACLIQRHNSLAPR